MNLISSFVTNNPCYVKNRTINVSGIMLHSVGTPQPSAAPFIRSWNKSSNGICVHGIIEPNGNVYQLLPWNYRASHCGGSGNNRYIGIEMTEPNTIKYTGGANWKEIGDGTNTKQHVLDTYKYAVELFAMLCNMYGLNPLTKNVIISHSEGHRIGVASGHADVEHLWNKFGLTMDQFRRDISAHMNGDSITTTAPGTGSTTNSTTLLSSNAVLKKGSSGSEVNRLRSLLTNKFGMYCGGETGAFDDTLEKVVRDFQLNYGLEVDGMVGKGSKTVLETHDKITVKNENAALLQRVLNAVYDARLECDGNIGPKTVDKCPLLYKGVNVDYRIMIAYNTILAYEYGKGVLASSSVFDSATDKATRELQSSKNLVADGKVGKNTWTAISKDI